jgi:hypothetical protein
VVAIAEVFVKYAAGSGSRKSGSEGCSPSDPNHAAGVSNIMAYQTSLNLVPPVRADNPLRAGGCNPHATLARDAQRQQVQLLKRLRTLTVRRTGGDDSRILKRAMAVREALNAYEQAGLQIVLGELL